jgi:hypothetical protein
MKRLALVAAAGLAGCSLFAGKVSVYVENGADQPIEVVVDGGPPVSVPVGGVATIQVAPGSRKFTVRRGGSVVYDQAHDLAAEQDGAAKYVLNPDRTRRYQVATVQYKKKTYGSALPSFDPVWDVLQGLRLLEPDPWLQGPYHAVFDEPLPETIRVKEGETAFPKFKVCRLTSADYDLLVATKANRPSDYPPEVIAAVKRATLCI